MSASRNWMNRSVLMLPSTMRKLIWPRAEIAEIIDSFLQRVGVASTGVLPRGA
jgi:hypothetical protein